MLDNKYYYDEQIKDYFYERNIQSFCKTKENFNDNNLVALLSLLTKQNLTEIAKRLEVKGYSKLGKDALVSLISDTLKENLQDILKDLSFKELTLLKELAKKDFNDYVFNIEELAPIGGLTSLGLLYKISIQDSLKIIVPQEIKDGIKEITSSRKYMNNLKEISKATNYIDGLITHYGLVNAKDLYEILTNPEIEAFDNANLDYYINYIFRCYEAFSEVGSIVHPFIFSPEDVFEEIRVRHTIPYNYNNAEYFISLGEDFKSLFDDNIENLKNTLINMGLKKSTADLKITELLFYIKNDMGTQTLINLLNDNGVKFNNKDEADKIIALLVEVYNNTGMWTLKGLSPKEVSERRTTVIKKDKEPGRNEPCTCGSGKKYKKCCGK